MLNPKQLRNFWKKIEKTDNCWNWTAGKNRAEYGQFKVNGKMKYAHRVSYEINVGPIPAGLQIHHHCKNPSCIRPSHLSVVSQRTNTLVESDGLAAKNAIKTRCDHGHEFNEENTHVRKTKSGIGRECKTCKREQKRRCRANKKLIGV